jgi:hypothetical protein
MALTNNFYARAQSSVTPSDTVCQSPNMFGIDTKMARMVAALQAPTKTYKKAKHASPPRKFSWE